MGYNKNESSLKHEREKTSYEKKIKELSLTIEALNSKSNEFQKEI